jgi:ribosomal protein L30, bacterial/organelle
MAKVKLTLVRSTIGRSKRQKATIEALGLRKLNQSIEKETSPAVLGMIKKVEHLLSVEEV